MPVYIRMEDTVRVTCYPRHSCSDHTTITGTSPRAAVRRKNELIWNVTRSIFPEPATTTILFYDYGAAHYYPRSPQEDWLTVTAPGTLSAAWKEPGLGYRPPPGWLAGAGHGTLTESFANDTVFTTSLYEVHQMELTRTKFTVVAEVCRPPSPSSLSPPPHTAILHNH
eukprot:COSAG05_NODE_291_length_12036_cov_15.352266_4_plen_168_part_00